MLLIEEYIKQSKDLRQKHIVLSEPGIERGGPKKVDCLAIVKA